MSSTPISRRNLLQVGSASLSGALLGSALQASPAHAASGCGGLTRQQFDEYLTLFNNNDPSFIKFYHDDVVLELANTEIKGAQAIRDFYAEVKAHVHEKVEVTHFVSDATGIAAVLPTEFKVYKDWPNGYFKRPLHVGDVMRTISFGIYWIENGKFRQIKAARYRQIHDWRRE